MPSDATGTSLAMMLIMSNDKTQASPGRSYNLRSIPDFCLSSAVLVATYDSDVTVDGVWSTLIDLTGGHASVALVREAR